ncbi:VWA domain-containing protein [Sesbania bispinosa]|nr:VWA domain-containing protein [Sesbania bispinosa]
MVERLAKKFAAKKGNTFVVILYSSSWGTSSTPSGDDNGKSKMGEPSRLPIVDMSDAEVKEQLRLQGKKLFEGKSEEEMKDYLNTLSDWYLGGAMMAQFFVQVVIDLAALPKIKKSFHEVASKLQSDEVIMNEALAKVKALTEERDNLNASNILQQLVMEKAEN